MKSSHVQLEYGLSTRNGKKQCKHDVIGIEETYFLDPDKTWIMISNCYLQLTTDTHIHKYTCMYVYGHILEISYSVALCNYVSYNMHWWCQSRVAGWNQQQDIKSMCFYWYVVFKLFINSKISSDKRNSDILAHLNVWCARQESEIAKHVQSLW